MKDSTLFSLLALIMLSACGVTASSKDAVPASMFAITDIAIIDVERGAVVPQQTVLVVNDRIDRIGATGKVRIPQDATRISGQGLYLIPGLVDAHVHYLDAPVFGRVMLANGVLLVRDMGMPNEFILPLREKLNQDVMLGPEMVATGYILDGNPPLIPSISLSIGTPEDARNAVRQQAEAGVDCIKVYSTLSKDVFLTILEEAHKLGLEVVGHVPDSITIEDAAATGLASAEHWFGFEKIIARLLGEPVNLTYTGMGSQAHYLERFSEVDAAALHEVFQQLRASGLIVVPTVVTFQSFPSLKSFEAAEVPGSEFISPSVLAIWQSQRAGQSEAPDYIWQNWAQMVKEIHAAGIPLMVGTDLLVPGIIPGFAVHQEMAIWQEAGIPPADILRSATLVPAQFMGLDDRLGSITVGKTASMVLVRANPLEDIRNAQQIEKVFLRGQVFSRGDLDQLLIEAQEMARQQVPPQ